MKISNSVQKGGEFWLKSAGGELWQIITSKLVREENTFYYLDNICITSSSMKLWFALHFPSPQLDFLFFLNFLSSSRFLDSIWSISKAPQKMSIWTDHTHELLGRPKVYKGLLFWDAILPKKNQILPKGPQEVASEVSSIRWAEWPQEMTCRSQASWKFFIIIINGIGLQRASQNSLQIFRTAKSAQKVSGAQCAHKVIFTSASQWPQKMTWNY